jgi:hypothetical protein
MNSTTDNSEISRLIEVIENLNSRVSALEASRPESGPEPSPFFRKEISKESSEDMEFRIGEQWFGKIGVIAFLFALFYLLTIPFDKTPHLLVLAFGFLTSSLMIAASFFKQDQLKSLGGYIAGSGIIIFYFSVLKLHYFTDYPVVQGISAIIPLLYLASIAALFLSLKKASPVLVVISLILFGTSALLSDSAVLILLSLILFSAASVYISRKYEWNNVLMASIPLVYLFFLLWFIGNPLTGGALRVVQDASFGLLLLPILLSIFGFSRLKISEGNDDYYTVLKSSLNAIPGYLLFLYVTINIDNSYSALLNFAMSALLIFLAADYWMKQRSKISTFIYSMTGYGAFSFAIIQSFSSPELYLLLSWQSLLVVSTALWFRSRFIIVANFFIFLLVALSYFMSQDQYNFLSLSVGLVALISARLINVHQQRLELQSEHLRNAYLVIAFLSIPYILYAIIPTSLVGISWVALAFVYYIVGKLLNNKKYRLMASATLIMSLVYIFIFGLTSSDTLYKILSFLLVSIALVIISWVYSRVRLKG